MSYAQEEGHWQERDVDHGRDHNFVNQDDAKDYESNFDEYDNYSEQYEDDLREECDRGHYAYHERSFEDTAEESPFTGSYRSEDLRTTNRQWPNIRDYTNTQGFQARNQGSSQYVISPYNINGLPRKQVRGIQKMIILMNCQILRTNIKIIAFRRVVERKKDKEN